jgi:TetR/AcrR family transcriptional repressor of mexJK operon
MHLNEPDMSSAINPKRQAILDAARRVFLVHGYSGASMEAIAEAAPVSKPTLYHHFHSKHELFAAVIIEQCDALLSTLSAAQTAMPDPAAGLKAIATAFVDLLYAEESLALYRLLIAEQQHFPELGEQVYRASAEPAIDQLSAYLTELHHRGSLHIVDADSSSQLLLGMLHGAQHFRCLLGLRAGLTPAEKHALIESAVSLFLKGHAHEA